MLAPRLMAAGHILLSGLLPWAAAFQPVAFQPTFVTARALPRPAPSLSIMHAVSRSAATDSNPSREKRLLRGVLTEALHAQQRKRSALEGQMASPLPSADGLDDDKAAKLRAKAMRRAQEVPQHLAAVRAAEMKLESLLELSTRGGNLSEIREQLEDMGLGACLESFDVDKAALDQWGRPEGFSGLVLESPRGVPILVGQRSFSDALLRRVGRGNDLFFQVREGRGSRVLMRTSMLRHLARSPRECMEMAADLAAYFSDSRPRWPDDGHAVEVSSKGEGMHARTR
jgi:hypothetical protein